MNMEMAETDGTIRVLVPMAIKRRSGRKELIVPDGVHSPTDSRPDYHEALVVAISRAHRFKKLLDEGRYGSVAEMAGALKMDRYKLARLLRLTLLAPRITEAILDGREPDSLSLNRLLELPALSPEPVLLVRIPLGQSPSLHPLRRHRRASASLFADFFGNMGLSDFPQSCIAVLLHWIHSTNSAVAIAKLAVGYPDSRIE